VNDFKHITPLGTKLWELIYGAPKIIKKKIERFLRWLHCIEFADSIICVYKVALSTPSVRRFKRKNPEYPIPPLSLSYDAYGDLNPEIHKDDEYSRSFCEVFSSHVENQDGATILEWGCGPGRMIRHIPEILGNKNVSVYGSDYNERTISWCRNNLPGINFHKNELTPPLSFDDCYFDFIYVSSVFTHLSEENCLDWIIELRRVLKYEGVLIFTTHSDLFTDKLDEKEKAIYHTKGILERNQAREGKRCYVTYHSPSYIRQNYMTGFEELEAISDKTRFFQDAWVIRKIHASEHEAPV